MKSSIKDKKYSDDFISVSKKTNLPVYNNLIEIANERAWEVSQIDYQDTINITRAISNMNYSQEDYETDDEILVKSFLDNEFYKTNVFENRMKLYCEFMDNHKNDKYIVEHLIYKTDSKFKTYYDLFGTAGCKSVCFRESELKRKIKVLLNKDGLKEKLLLEFSLKSRYTKKYIKQKLSEIYTTLGISKTPKAIDIMEFFETKEVLMTTSPGKRDIGFEIIGIKTI